MLIRSFNVTAIRRNLLSSLAGFRPGCESIVNATECGTESWSVAQKNGCKRVVGDPVHAGLRIDARRKIGGKEAVALQPARRHQNKDPKRRIREPKARW